VLSTVLTEFAPSVPPAVLAHLVDLVAADHSIVLVLTAMMLDVSALDPLVTARLPDLLVALLADENDTIAQAGLMCVACFGSAESEVCEICVRRFAHRIDEDIVALLVLVLSRLPEPPVSQIDYLLRLLASESEPVLKEMFNLIRRFGGRWGEAGDPIARAILHQLYKLPYALSVDAVTVLIDALPEVEPRDEQFFGKVVELLPDLFRPTAISALCQIIHDTQQKGDMERLRALHVLLENERPKLVEYCSDEEPLTGRFAQILLDICDLLDSAL
jgi:hypothetical protein